MPPIDAEYNDARSLATRGDLAGAELACERILKANPQHVPSLRLLAAIADYQNNLTRAIELIERAAAIEPTNADLQADLGRTQLRDPQRIDQGIASLQNAAKLHPTAAIWCDLAYGLLKQFRFDEAEQAINQSLALDPKFATAYCNRGALLRARGRPADAATAYATASKLQPQMVEALIYEGIARAEAGTFGKAEMAWERALRVRPGHATEFEIGQAILEIELPRIAAPYLVRAASQAPGEINYQIAASKALVRSQRFSEAEAAARAAVAVDSRNADAHLALATALHARNQYEAAVEEYKQTLALEPNSARALSGIGEAHSQLGNDDEAIAAGRAALAIVPTAPGVQGFLLQSLVRALRTDEAIDLGRRFVAEIPASAEAIINYGTVQYEMGDTRGAIELYRRALAIDPASTDGRLALGIALLKSGELPEGWREYDHRPRPPRDPRFARWDGSTLYGKPILLRIEQGFGDNIQFIRYAPLIAQRGGKVIVACAAPMQRLLRTVKGVDAVVTSTDDPQCARVKVEVVMLDLPGLFGTTIDTIPRDVPYVSVPPPSLVDRREKLLNTIDSESRSARLRVGLVWAGNLSYGHNRKRSIPIEILAPSIVAIPDVQFFSLQVNPIAQRDADAMKRLNIVDLSHFLGDFGDTAAALAKLDLIITVDTGVAHLAGALARPTWTLLPLVNDWRWMEDREDTPWYPTMQLFRQTKLGDWPSVIARVAAALQERVTA